jgi:hypothetical protein
VAVELLTGVADDLAAAHAAGDDHGPGAASPSALGKARVAYVGTGSRQPMRGETA